MTSCLPRNCLGLCLWQIVVMFRLKNLPATCSSSVPFGRGSIQARRCGPSARSFSNVFLTVAIAEWAFPLHPHLFDGISLTDTQLLFTRHAYHCLCQVLEKLLTNQFSPQTTGVTVFHEYTLRFEFQRRGTLHVHVLAWASLQLAASILTGQTGKSHQSPLVTLLEKIFRGSIDVQVLASLHAGCLCFTASKASLNCSTFSSCLCVWLLLLLALCAPRLVTLSMPSCATSLAMSPRPPIHYPSRSLLRMHPHGDRFTDSS